MPIFNPLLRKCASQSFTIFFEDAEALAERLEQRLYRTELHQLRGEFLGALGAEETQIEASFCEAIRIAREQKSVSLARRAEAGYAEYRRRYFSENRETSETEIP